MVDGKILFNLENLERNVRTCNPQAIEDALNVGADLEQMNSAQLAGLRAYISRYKEDCTCLVIPRPTKERAKEVAEKIKGTAKEYMGVAEKRAAPTIEKIKAEIEKAKKSPKVEEFKAGITPKIEKAKISIAPTIEKIKGKLTY